MSYTKTVLYKKGDYIYSAGDTDNNFYFVITGKVSIKTPNKNYEFFKKVFAERFDESTPILDLVIQY
jgi:CRP-like cAMP-binding protein